MLEQVDVSVWLFRSDQLRVILSKGMLTIYIVHRPHTF